MGRRVGGRARGRCQRWRVCARVASRARTLFLAHLLGDTHESVPDDLPLLLRGGRFGERGRLAPTHFSRRSGEGGGGVEHLQLDTDCAQCRRHRRRFLLTHEAVVDVEGDHALAADGFVEERRTHA